jgi:hypothetical protein
MCGSSMWDMGNRGTTLNIPYNFILYILLLGHYVKNFLCELVDSYYFISKSVMQFSTNMWRSIANL